MSVPTPPIGNKIDQSIDNTSRNIADIKDSLLKAQSDFNKTLQSDVNTSIKLLEKNNSINNAPVPGHAVTELIKSTFNNELTRRATLATIMEKTSEEDFLNAYSNAYNKSTSAANKSVYDYFPKMQSHTGTETGTVSYGQYIFDKQGNPYIPTQFKIAQNIMNTPYEFGYEDFYADVYNTSGAWDGFSSSQRASAIEFLKRMPTSDIKYTYLQNNKLVDVGYDGSFEYRDVYSGNIVGGGSDSSYDSVLNGELDPFSLMAPDSDETRRWYERNGEVTEEEQQIIWLRDTTGEHEITSDLDKYSDYLGPDTSQMNSIQTYEQFCEWYDRKFAEEDTELVLTDEDITKMDIIMDIVETAYNLSLTAAKAEQKEAKLELIENALTTQDDSELTFMGNKINTTDGVISTKERKLITDEARSLRLDLASDKQERGMFMEKIADDTLTRLIPIMSQHIVDQGNIAVSKSEQETIL